MQGNWTHWRELVSTDHTAVLIINITIFWKCIWSALVCHITYKFFGYSGQKPMLRQSTSSGVILFCCGTPINSQPKDGKESRKIVTLNLQLKRSTQLQLDDIIGSKCQHSLLLRRIYALFNNLYCLNMTECNQKQKNCQREQKSPRLWTWPSVMHKLCNGKASPKKLTSAPFKMPVNDKLMEIRLFPVPTTSSQAYPPKKCSEKYHRADTLSIPQHAVSVLPLHT